MKRNLAGYKIILQSCAIKRHCFGNPILQIGERKPLSSALKRFKSNHKFADVDILPFRWKRHMNVFALAYGTYDHFDHIQKNRLLSRSNEIELLIGVW